MSSNTVFKRLFEVQIVHDYFLTSSDGFSFFERNEEDKRDVLTKKLAHNNYDVRKLYSIEPIGETDRRMSEYKLLLRKTALGFIVGLEVTVESLAGETLYKPKYDFSDKLSLTFSVRPRLSFFKSITNLGLRPPLTAVNYFTNKDKEAFNEIVLPSYASLPLANKTETHQDGMIHEMGTLVDFSGSIREAKQLTNTDGGDLNLWDIVVDRRFVGDADRVLLPGNFEYTLKKDQNITQIDFILEDKDGNAVKTISKSSPDPIERVFLNFSIVDETIVPPVEIPSGFYTLKITHNTDPEITYTIYINEEIYDKEYLGVIDIRSDEPNPPFSLLDAAGFLKARIDVSNIKVSHPVFELRFKNRRTYWRYNQEIDFINTDITATQDHLVQPLLNPKQLISRKPMGLTETLVPFTGPAPMTLPHPRRPSIRVEGEKIYSEIYINQANKLLNS